MKKFLFIALIVFSGCAKTAVTSDIKITQASQIVGKWAFVSYIVLGHSSPITQLDYIQFNDDSTGLMVYQNQKTDFGFLLTDSKLGLTDKAMTSGNTTTYVIKKLDDHNLDISTDGIEMVFTK